MLVSIGPSPAAGRRSPAFLGVHGWRNTPPGPNRHNSNTLRRLIWFWSSRAYPVPGAGARRQGEHEPLGPSNRIDLAGRAKLARPCGGLLPASPSGDTHRSTVLTGSIPEHRSNGKPNASRIRDYFGAPVRPGVSWPELAGHSGRRRHCQSDGTARQRDSAPPLSESYRTPLKDDLSRASGIE